MTQTTRRITTILTAVFLGPGLLSQQTAAQQGNPARGVPIHGGRTHPMRSQAAAPRHPGRQLATVPATRPQAAAPRTIPGRQLTTVPTTRAQVAVPRPNPGRIRTPSTLERGALRFPSAGRFDSASQSGSRTGGSYQNRGGNQSIGGYFYDKKGNGLGGGFSRQDGTTTVQGEYRGPGQGKGTQERIGGSYTSNGRDTSISGRYGVYDSKGGLRSGYDGGIDRHGNEVTVQGGYSKPGFVPGTVDHYGGSVNARGRDSSVSGRYDVSDAPTGTRVGGGTATMDRKQYTQNSDGHVGPVSGTSSNRVTFKGLDSSYQASQETSVSSVGRMKYDYGISRNGGQVGAEAKLGGVKVGANVKVDSKGVHADTTLPEVKLPKVQVPEVKLPKVQAPSVSLPSFKSPF
jgi:hypothetical protein